MKPIPDVKWNGVPCRDDEYGYHFRIHADSRDEVVAWMGEAEAENKRLREGIIDNKELAMTMMPTKLFEDLHLSKEKFDVFSKLVALEEPELWEKCLKALKGK